MLSPAEVGEYSYILSLITPISIFAGLGLGTTAIRELSAAIEDEDRSRGLRLIQWIVKWGFGSVIFTALVLGFLGRLLGINGNLVWLVSLWFAFLAAQKLIVEIIRGLQKTNLAAMFHGGRIGGVFASLVILGILFWSWRIEAEFQLRGALTTMVLGILVSFFLSGGLLIKEIISRFGRLCLSLKLPPINILGLSLPILVHDISTLLPPLSGIWVLKAFQATTQIAIFSTAQQLVNLLAIQQNIIIFVLSPEIATLYASDELRKLEKLLRRITTLASISMGIAFLVLVFWGGEILGFLYGGYYRAGKPILLLLAIGIIGHVLSGPCGLTLAMTGHQKKLMVISLISGLFTLAIAIVLVKMLDVVGVAIAFSVGYLIKNLWMVLQVKKSVGIWTCAMVKLR